MTPELPQRYYTKHLAGARLARCYDLAPPRIHQYLEAEILFVSRHLQDDCSFLELGCGTGRVLRRLSPRPKRMVGIDTSLDSLRFAQKLLAGASAELIQTDAVCLGLGDASFDMTVCVQNGISAIGDVDRRQVVREALRVTRAGGIVLFSTYTDAFWEHRLQWFRLQAAQGLLGEVDESRTRDGVIVCRDGFRATTLRPEELQEMADGLEASVTLEETDQSSLFAVIRK